MLSQEQLKIRARLANAVSRGDTARADELRRLYKIAKVATLVESDDPRLTASDRVQLAQRILAGGAAA